MYVVYEHWLDGKCFCVGSGTKYRPKNFKSRKRAWQEYVNGRYDDIIVKIVKTFDDRQEAYNYEIEHHKEMVKLGHPIQNLLGNSGYWTGKKRPDVGKKISKSLTGRHLSEEHKRHISEHNGRGNLGKSMSEGARNKLSQSIRNKYANDTEYRNKIIIAQRRRRERERLQKELGGVTCLLK